MLNLLTCVAIPLLTNQILQLVIIRNPSIKQNSQVLYWGLSKFQVEHTRFVIGLKPFILDFFFFSYEYKYLVMDINQNNFMGNVVFFLSPFGLFHTILGC